MNWSWAKSISLERVEEGTVESEGRRWVGEHGSVKGLSPWCRSVLPQRAAKETGFLWPFQEQ